MSDTPAQGKSLSSGGLHAPANRLAGKICVVLGGTGNVGAGVAQAFAAEGAAKVVVTSRSQAKIDAVRAQWGWPESVVGVIGSFGDDAEAASTIERVWEQAGGPVDHCVVSVGFGGMTAPFSEDSADAAMTFLTTHQWPRLRAAIQASKKMLEADVPGSSLTMPSGALAAGMHKFPFPGFSGAWMNGVGGSLYIQMCNAIACEAKDKKKHLRAHAVVVFPGVSKHGEDKQQMGMPAAPDSSVHLGQGWVAVVLDTTKENGDPYQFGSFENFDFTDMDAFVAKVFTASKAPSSASPSLTPPKLVVAVQNCGNAGLYAIKTLIGKDGVEVRTSSRNPDKLKSTKLAGIEGVKVFKSGDPAFFAGVDRFIAIPPGTENPDDRAKTAIEFVQKCVDAGATHGSAISVVVADKSNRRGLFGAQFGLVEDTLAGMNGISVCTIRAPFFMDNMWGDVDTIKSHDTFYAPISSDTKQLVSAVADVGEALAVGALDAVTHGNKAYFVLGDRISKGAIAALYSQKLGRAIKHVQASEEAATEAMKGFGFKQWQIDGILELNNLNDSADFMAEHSGDFKKLTGRDPMTTSQYLDAVLIPALDSASKAPSTLVVAVQNCGNAGLYAIKTLIGKDGVEVRTSSRNPDKLKSTKLAGIEGVKVFKSGDPAFFAGVDRFIAIPPGTENPDDRAKTAIEFVQKCVDAGATHGSAISVVVADKSNRRGLFGAQFGLVEDTLAGMNGISVCTIRAPFFMDNMWGDVDTIKSHDTFYAPISSDTKQLVSAVADVGEALAVGALDAVTHGNKAYFVLGDRISKGAIAALYSQKLGRAIKHVQASEEAATEAMKGFGFKQWQIDGILELNNLNDSADFMAEHSGDFKKLTGRDPMTTSQYLDAVLIPALAPDTSTHSYTMCSICPTFTVQDWDKAKPIMDDFIKRTKSETGCVYYGWTRTGDQLKCREMYADGAAVNAHLENVGPCIQAILAEGVAKLDKIDIQGPADQLEIVKPGTETLGTVYYHTDGGFTNMASATGGGEIAYDICSIHPTFTVHDWDKAKPIMEEFITRTKNETGCVYYGWVRSGNKLKCREAYVNGDAINDHLANVGSCVQAILADGVASLDSINIHGPADQLEIVKPGTEAFGAKYFATDGGFSRYTIRKPILLVMGFGPNVGGGTADVYANHGYEVAIVSRTQSKLDAISAKYAAKGMKVVGFAADLSKPDSIQALVNKIEHEMGPITHCLFNATVGAPRHIDSSEKHSCFYADTDAIMAASNTHVNSMHATLNALLVRWKVRGRGTFLLSGGGFCFDGSKAVNWAPSGKIPSWEIGAGVKAYWKAFAEAANVTLLPLGIRVGCFIIERIVGTDWEHGIPEAFVKTPTEIGDAFYAFAHRSEWGPTEIWPPRPDDASESGESKSSETPKARTPSVLSSQYPAKSCKIVSHTSKRVVYTIEIEGISGPIWTPKSNAKAIDGGITVDRHFTEFKKIHHVMVKHAKASKVTAPPKMPDNGGPLMWTRRNNPKVIAHREAVFNELLTYMIETPVINELPAVMDFLELNFRGAQ
eukprot:g3797.t1